MIPNVSIEALNSTIKGTLMEVMGVEYTDFGEGFLCAKMPVDQRTKQPAGLLHGGANAALVETLGSMGSVLIVGFEEYNVTGIEVNANHIKGVKEGWVYGKATIVHQGRTMHVWNIEITNEEGQLVSTGRITNLILKKKG